MEYTWKRKGGYEVSTKGDKRFSAFNARLEDGRSIEDHYQCDIKGYRNWREGKGNPPLNPEIDLWTEYLALWTQWATKNQNLIEELRTKANEHNGVLSDMFASTEVNQARALAHILNDTKT